MDVALKWNRKCQLLPIVGLVPSVTWVEYLLNSQV